MDRADARMDRFEKQLIATRDLVRGGVVLVGCLTRDVSEFRESVSELRGSVSELKDTVQELVRAQKRTDARIDRLVDVMLRQHTNGRRRSGR
jgi:hypothetical protein